MPVQIKYPAGWPDVRGLSGTMHDLNNTLYNPDPKKDWKTGDVAWVYVRKERHIVTGPITHISGRPDGPQKQFCFVKDIVPDGVTPDAVGADYDELFETEADLMNAMLRGTVAPSDATWTRETIQDEAYRRYQLDWMANHGRSARELVTRVIEFIQAGADPEDPDECDVHAIDADETFSDWESDDGFAGSLWACKDEFLGAEYRDAAYMRHLLPVDAYGAYLAFRDAN